MAKIIFTADDYGCMKNVDDGIIVAAQEGLINSVAAFANGYKAKDRLRRLKEHQDTIDIGCHLTITSGSPLTSANSFRKGKYFRTFTELERDGDLPESRLKAIKAELKDEIKKQIDVLNSVGIDVKHLSSHHNSLVFFPEYFTAQLEIAREMGIKVRSATIVPKGKNKLYIAQIRVRSIDNMKHDDRKELTVFSKNVNNWLNKYQDKTKSDPNAFPSHPDSINGMHYGPLGLVKVRRSAIDRKAKRKSNKLWDAIQDLNDNEVIEYCFHLNSLDRFKPKQFKDKNSPDYYPGVDPSYFDSRQIELKSLMYAKKNNQFPVLTRWDNI